jgi:MFS family permease
MYRLEWIEQLKLRFARRPSAKQVAQVNPVVWKLGWTSFLTDISAEMVNSALPVYLVLYLRLSPLEYGAIDGMYNGLSVALVGLAAAVWADRTGRLKYVAVAGYGTSAVCKLLLLAAGGVWSWLLAIVWLDRTGKGIRTAPRDAIISLASSPSQLATSFAVHRALDAGGSLLGPLVAFAVLWWLPTGYDVVWITSFGFALLGLAVLWLFVRNPERAGQLHRREGSLKAAAALLFTRRFGTLASCGLLLSIVTISDGFIYLLLQEKGQIGAGLFPLFYVVTACFYMFLSIPAGIVADRFGRMPVLLAGYSVLGLLYLLLMTLPVAGLWSVALCLFLFGLFYAATEGVLTAMASALVPSEIRTSGLALMVTVVGLGKLISSVVFGWMWQAYGIGPSLLVFGVALAALLPMVGLFLRAARRD